MKIQTFKKKLKEARFNFQNIFIIHIIIVLTILFGCGSCGGVKNKMKNITTINVKEENSEPDQKDLIFPADFPRMNNMPDHIPNAEILADIVSYEPLVKVFHLFDTFGKYIGKRDNSDFPEISKINILRNDNIDNDGIFTINDINRAEIFNSLNEFGFKIPKSIFNKVTMLNGPKGEISELFDFNEMKSVGFQVSKSVSIFDAANCTLGQYKIVNIYNYKGELERILDYPNIGEEYWFTSNRNICFSTFWNWSCGYEPEIIIDHHRFSNFKSNYYYDFNPIDISIFPQEFNYGNPDFIIKDSLLLLIYSNAERFLRVVVEPYDKKIFYKLYDTKVEYGGKYHYLKFHESLTNMKLPDGKLEDYKSYTLLVSKK
jgi:hypothetical protein